MGHGSARALVEVPPSIVRAFLTSKKMGLTVTVFKCQHPQISCYLQGGPEAAFTFQFPGGSSTNINNKQEAKHPV